MGIIGMQTLAKGEKAPQTGPGQQAAYYTLPRLKKKGLAQPDFSDNILK